MENIGIWAETKATSQHQITIPKKIWAMLHLQAGTRFNVILNERKQIVVTPQSDSLDLSNEEWDKLMALAHSKKNISKSFRNAKDAISYLKKI